MKTTVLGVRFSAQSDCTCQYVCIHTHYFLSIINVLKINVWQVTASHFIYTVTYHEFFCPAWPLLHLLTFKGKISNDIT